MRQQGFHFLAQGFVALAGLLEVSSSLARLKLQSRVIEFLDLFPAFRCHNCGHITKGPRMTNVMEFNNKLHGSGIR